MIVFAVVYYGNYFGETRALCTTYEKAVSWIEDICGVDYAITNNSDYTIEEMKVE